MTVWWSCCHSGRNVGTSCSCLKLGFFSEQLLVRERCQVDRQAYSGSCDVELGMCETPQV